MNDIALCGSDIRFCRMLELELQAFGYTVTYNPQSGSYRLWIMDLDTTSPKGTEPILLGITRGKTELSEECRRQCSLIFYRPFPMSLFRKEIAHLLSADQPIPRSSPVSSLLVPTPYGFAFDGKPLSLTETERLILQALYEHRGETVSRTELCALLGNESNDKLADVYVCLLRKKLETTGNPRLLFTVRGIGYRLDCEKNEE